jgi:hypothetical protein
MRKFEIDDKQVLLSDWSLKTQIEITSKGPLDIKELQAALPYYKFTANSTQTGSQYEDQSKSPHA